MEPALFAARRSKAANSSGTCRASALSVARRGPLLTSDVPEVGTNYPTITQPNFPAVRAAFEQNNPVVFVG